MSSRSDTNRTVPIEPNRESFDVLRAVDKEDNETFDTTSQKTVSPF